MRRLLFSLLAFTIVGGVKAQRMTPEDYIRQYKDVAISEMKRMGIPAAITLAQGILESENGNSDLVKRSNNHFGIKCKNTWTGERVYHDDDANGECFRMYKDAIESFRDHSNFLRNNDRYSFLFKLDAKDYRGWALGLKRAGYATNKFYPDILVKNIEQYNLQQYTLLAVNELPVFDASKYQDDKEDTVLAVKMNDSLQKTTELTSDSNIVSLLDVAEKIIIINNCKCVIANKGTSVLVVAVRNHIDLDKLLEYNELSEDGILAKTQYLYLQKKAKTGETDFYIVKEGESLYQIAQQNGIQLQYLLDYNGLNNEDKVAAGTKLFLRTVKKIKISNKKTGKTAIHQVGAKEGLFLLAKKYKVTLQQLRDWNQLENDEIKIGQKLIVSE